MDRFLIIDLWMFGAVIFVLGFVSSANVENLDDVTNSENVRMGNEIRPTDFEENLTNIHNDEFGDADEMGWRTETRMKDVGTYEDRSLPDLSMFNLQMDPVAYWAAIYGTEDVPEFEEPPEIEGDSIFLDFGDLDEDNDFLDENVPAKVLVKRAAEPIEENLNEDHELTLRKTNRRRQRGRASRKHRNQSRNWNYQSVMSADGQQDYSHAIPCNSCSEKPEDVEFPESDHKHVEFGEKASSHLGIDTSLGSRGVEHNSVSSHGAISNSDASQALDMLVESKGRVLDAKKNVLHAAISGSSKAELNDAIHRTIEAKKDLLESVIETGSQIAEAKKELIHSHLEASNLVGKIADGTRNTVLEDVADSTSKVLDAKQNLLHAVASGSGRVEVDNAIRRTIEAKKDLLDSVIETGSQILEEKKDSIHSHLETSPVVTDIVGTISEGTRNTVLENVADSTSKVLDAKQNLLHAVASGSSKAELNDAIHRTIEAKKDLLDSVIETGSQILEEKKDSIHSHLNTSPVVTTIVGTISEATRNTVLEDVADSTSKVLDAKQNLLHAVASGSGRVDVDNAIRRTIEAKKDLLDSVIETGSQILEEKKDSIHSHLEASPVVTTIVGTISEATRNTILEDVADSTSKVLDAKQNLLHAVASGSGRVDVDNAIRRTIEAKKDLLDSVIETGSQILEEKKDSIHSHLEASPVVTTIVGTISEATRNTVLENVADSTSKVLDAKQNLLHAVASGSSKADLNDAIHKTIEAKKDLLDSVIETGSQIAEEKKNLIHSHLEASNLVGKIADGTKNVVDSTSKILDAKKNLLLEAASGGSRAELKNAIRETIETTKENLLGSMDAVEESSRSHSSANAVKKIAVEGLESVAESKDKVLEAKKNLVQVIASGGSKTKLHDAFDRVITAKKDTLNSLNPKNSISTQNIEVISHPTSSVSIDNHHFTISGNIPSNMHVVPIEIFHSRENDGIVDEAANSLVIENKFEIAKSFGKASSSSEEARSDDSSSQVESTDLETPDTITVNNVEASAWADNEEEDIGSDGFGIRYEGNTVVTVKVNDSLKDKATGASKEDEVVEEEDSSEENWKDDGANSHKTSLKTVSIIDGHIGAQTSGGKNESIGSLSETTLGRISISRNKTTEKHPSTHRFGITLDSISGTNGLSQILPNYETCMSGLFNISSSDVDLESDLYSTASDFELQCVNASLRHIFHSCPPIIEKTVQKCLQFGKEMQGYSKGHRGKGVFRKLHAPAMLKHLETMLTQVVADKNNYKSQLFLFGTKLLLRKLKLNFDISPKMFVDFLKRHALCITGKTICEAEPKRCPKNLIYRTIDGSCNNEHHPSWGQSNTMYARLLPARYADGIHEPALSVTGAELPNARDLSVEFFSRKTFRDTKITLVVMQWGQFVVHDLAGQTPTRASGGGVQCCSKDGRVLPKKLQDPACMPIAIRPDDIFYSKYNRQCMNFVRSIIAPRDHHTLGPAEQLNDVTSYLDLSTVYGSDKETSDALRTFEQGQLFMEWREDHALLPRATNRSVGCDSESPEEACYIAGDTRVNQNPELAVMHTLMAREHNRIALDLLSVNPHWNDERLFQEARRIVIAEYQYITYNEWLPLILGNKYCQKYRLTSSHHCNYDARVNPSILNDFSNGAFRVFHSLVDGAIELCQANREVSDILRLSDHFLRPQVIEERNNLDDLIRGLVTQPALARGDRVHPEIGEYLFRSSNAYGLDLVALDIQRGRDHGLQGYNAYREICGLRRAETFADLIGEIPFEKIEKLAEHYSHVDDIDLMVGAALETKLRGCPGGPTLRCLTAEQFYRSKFGDRYFYDNANQPHPFTREQIEEIEKASLARLLCDTSDDLETIQVEAFKQIHPFNSLTLCDFLPRINLFAWKEHDCQEPIRCC